MCKILKMVVVIVLSVFAHQCVLATDATDQYDEVELVNSDDCDFNTDDAGTEPDSALFEAMKCIVKESTDRNNNNW